MKKLPDISEWCTAERALDQEVQWLLSGVHKLHLEFLLPRLVANDIKSIVEFGPGTGHLASGLPPDIPYIGIEKNEWFLARARTRNPGKEFVLGDVRDFKCSDGTVHDLGMAWYFLKNFAIEEFKDIVGRMLADCKFGCFNVQVSSEEFDNGVEYHHSFVTREMAADAACDAGHKLIESKVLEEFRADGRDCRDVVYWTRRVV